jgi:hypothetical protein
MNIKSRKKCLRAKEGCAWCENSFMATGSNCVSEMTVKYMPESISKCEMPKDKKLTDQAATDNKKKHHDDKVSLS